MEYDPKQLIAQYADKVDAVARSEKAFKKLDIPLEDLVNTGMIGLLRAADRYTPNAGCTFWTFAEHRVRGEIRNSLPKQRRLPRRVVFDNARAQVEHESSSEQGQNVRMAFDLSWRITTTMNFDLAESPATADGENSSSPERSLERAEDSKRLWQAVDRLPPRHRTVIEQRFRLGIPFTTIAKSLGIDKSGVTRLYQAAVRQLKAELEWGVPDCNAEPVEPTDRSEAVIKRSVVFLRDGEEAPLDA